jgi:uncharacterized protein YfiM (DUF2279 family)
MWYSQRLLVILFFIVMLTTISAAEDRNSSREEWLSKEDKLLVTNVGGITVLTIWGLTSWDYGERGSHIRSEGWFQQNTPEGGADKLAHFYASYLTAHGISALCESWGYTTEQSARYGAISSFGLMGVMEFGDSFSHYGFSVEDFIMNTAGCVAGFYLYRYPELARKIDFRLEYIPDFSADDMSTNYENMKFLTAVKADGFDCIKNPYLKFLEFQLGYYARGYSDENEPNRRNLYAAVGINLSRVVSEMSYRKTAAVFQYYQVPYTYLPIKHKLDK